MNSNEAFDPLKIIAGHLEDGWELDAKADLAHNRRYLDLFAEKITHAKKKKPLADELFQTLIQGCVSTANAKSLSRWIHELILVLG